MARPYSNDLRERVAWAVASVRSCREVALLFLFIGADPNSAWLGECDAVRDAKGFVLTGEALDDDALKGAGWRADRRPAPLETSIPGVFAIGDVRAGSVKRVAAAVGEGAAVVAQLHAHLAGAGE